MMVRRYWLPEVLGTVAAVAAGRLTFRATGSAWAAAWGAMLGETVGYYGPILWRDTRGHRRGARFRATIAQLPGLLVEFGPAEVLDTFTRPVLMYVGPPLTGELTTGTVLGKIAADLLFYAVVVPCRLLRLRGRAATAPGPATVTESVGRPVK
ncbi:hypothetical protein ACWKSP_01535 [Micromonosporaceae bacterium Da 78-11]